MRVTPDNWVAPAGSNRSRVGGNETVEAFGAKGRLGRPRDQAGRNASQRRAGLEKVIAGAEPASNGEGRHRAEFRATTFLHGPGGVVATACLDRSPAQHGKPCSVVVSTDRKPARDRPGQAASAFGLVRTNVGNTAGRITRTTIKGIWSHLENAATNLKKCNSVLHARPSIDLGNSNWRRCKGPW